VVAILAHRLGYNLEQRQPVQVMAEIAQFVPSYAGVTYARLERTGVSAPVASFAEMGTPILSSASGLQPRLLPAGASTSHLN
jgi:predicted molibdopterin-dependent oxidoreductase YjgC